jgi:putative membrane protein
MGKPKWQSQGREPDYRFTLANERTFLAWIRTALALLAGGALLDQFSSELGPPMVLFTLAAVLATAYGTWRFKLHITRRCNSVR